MNLKLVMIFFFLSIFSVQAQTSEKNKCYTYLKNNYKQYRIHKFFSINKKDTLSVNTARYECVYSTLYLNKVMFDKYGKWDELYRLAEPKQVVLVWNNIKLFDDSEIKYTIATSGLEGDGLMYTSVFVFDENNNDMFSESSTKKDFLLRYFGKLIKKNKSSNKDFYKVYWKEVDIKKWEKLYGKSK